MLTLSHLTVCSAVKCLWWHDKTRTLSETSRDVLILRDLAISCQPVLLVLWCLAAGFQSWPDDGQLRPGCIDVCLVCVCPWASAGNFSAWLWCPEDPTTRWERHHTFAAKESEELLMISSGHLLWRGEEGEDYWFEGGMENINVLNSSVPSMRSRDRVAISTSTRAPLKG